MDKKIVGVFICMLLILTAFPTAGQLKDSSIRRDTYNKINPLLNDKWMKTFDGLGIEMDGSAIQTSDGGYIIVGETVPLSQMTSDILLIKTDNKGNKMWEKTFGEENNDYSRIVKQTSDNGYIIVGFTGTDNSIDSDVLLIKTDNNGNEIWNKIIDTGGVELGFDVIETRTGEFLIIGEKGPYGENWFFTDVLLIKTDIYGNKIWEKTYGGEYHDDGWSLQELSDDGYIITGCYGLEKSSSIWLLRTNVDGDLLWDKKFYHNNIGNGNSVKQTTDNGFIIGGETVSDTGLYEIWLLKTDSEGNLVWDKLFGGIQQYFCGSIQQTNDGGYIICGYNEKSIRNVDGLLIKTDSEGEKEWIKTYGGNKADVLYSVQQTTDGGYILSGHYTKGLLNMDLWLVKTDGDGNAPNSYSKNLTKQKIFSLFQNFFRFLKVFNWR